ncbi:MAG: hypothetical protein DDT32_02263 [Syntrophomonadaceae bacterium]|nr:hypothetical protein [Bacillota bacterium]
MPPTNLWTNEPLGAGTYSVVLGPRSQHRVTVTSTGSVRDKKRAVQVDLSRQGNVVGFWKFDEGDGTRAHDSTRNKNHGEIEGDTTWIIDPERGSVLLFDGDEDYVAIDTEPPFNLTHEITLDHWFRTTHSQNGEFMVVNGEPWNGEPGPGFFYGTRLTNASRTLSFYVRLRNAGVRLVSYTIPGQGFRDGNWHRVTATFDGRYLRLYHNRVLRGTTDIGVEDTIAPDYDEWPTLYFAKWGDNYFQGALDEIKITGRGLPLPLRENIAVEHWQEVPVR